MDEVNGEIGALKIFYFQSSSSFISAEISPFPSLLL